MLKTPIYFTESAGKHGGAIPLFYVLSFTIGNKLFIIDYHFPFNIITIVKHLSVFNSELIRSYHCK